MDEENLWDAEEIPIENPGSYGLGYCIGAPASEVLSVKIPLGQRHTCEVYGVIVIEDKDGNTYELYSRDVDDPETLTPALNTLSLAMPIECLVSNNWAFMRMHLQDKADDSVIVQQCLGLDKVTAKDDYNRVKVQQVGASALVSYASFSTAVLAVVEVTLVKRNHVPNAADLYGTIVARYGNTYGKKYPGIVLFNEPLNQPVRAVSDIPIKLSRDVLVVPAYSFVRIDVHLSDTKQQDFNGYADFPALHHNYFKKLVVETKDFVIQVEVQWSHPYRLENHDENRFKRPKISSDQHLSLTLTRGPVLRKHNLRPYELVEVFTLKIDHDSNNVIDIYGRMGISDHCMSCEVFNRNETNPVTLSTNCNTIPIIGPRRSFDGPLSLTMGLMLRDVQGRIFIQGDLSWYYDSVNRPISWYDRRISAVFFGVHGYATVFYTVFSEAVQAFVKVSFMSDGHPDVSHHVYGTIVARYSNEDYDERYSTEYEKAYYQSVLFKEARGNSLELKSGCRMPLLKSMVAVPADASLIVDVDLYASSTLDECSEERLEKVVGFGTIAGAYNTQVIQSKSHRIEISVEWIDYFELFKSQEKSWVNK
ncbi:hypothetical protein RND81_06G000300 [Saponaria officinalis]|uniref:DUF6598 domain-containing protein n=1 Tax=Saponaria officinalis TaxID=3572 RepID=A0AAW1K5W6_SAPOF